MPAQITVEVHQELSPLLPAFLDNRQRDLQQLAYSLAVADYAAIAHIAHNLKGVGTGYGFVQVSEIGERLEQAVRAADSGATAACVEEFRDFMQRCQVVYV